MVFFISWFGLQFLGDLGRFSIDRRKWETIREYLSSRVGRKSDLGKKRKIMVGDTGEPIELIRENQSLYWENSYQICLQIV